MKLTRRFITLVLAAGMASFGGPAMAQQTIKIGELSSYKAFPAFTDPYKKGWQMAVDEINATGGIDGKKLDVISRDDGANPGDAVRVAEELVSSEGVTVLAGTFLSNVGLAVGNFASQKKVFFLGSEPLTDKMTWSAGNKYTFRLRPSTYMQMAMVMPDVIAAHKKRWALVYPNFEYGQAASETFKEFIKKALPDLPLTQVRFRCR
jgi:branched-chain amino acid transport system substrate-binding protein